MPSIKFTTNKSVRLTYLQLAYLEQPLLKGKAGDVIRFLLDKLMANELPKEIVQELENKIAGVSSNVTGRSTTGQQQN